MWGLEQKHVGWMAAVSVVALSLAGCKKEAEKKPAAPPVAVSPRPAAPAPPPGAALPAAPFTLTSASFAHQAEIPIQHTCNGEDVSPPLAWSGVPPGTKSLALVVDDPDAPDPQAPRRVWVHWVLYDLPPTVASLPGGVRKEGLPAGAREGKNDWGRSGYRGPCPPRGRHRYFHKLYALDVTLGDLGTPSKARLERAMQGHILGKAELVGTYANPR